LGRFISEDPIGLAGGVNSFAYVSNNPQNSIDPSGLYEIDVHYYLTYYLASRNKCFTDEEARKIADGDQWTDEDENHRPGPGRNDKEMRQNADYHALHEGSHEPYLEKLWIDATRGHLNNPDLNLRNFGVYLHYRQDMFSHAGYTNEIYGHLFGMHKVDKTATDKEKALDMVKATWDALQAFAKEKKCGCQGDRSDVSLKKVIDFIKASGGPWSREINDPEIENKRRILDVPRR
jgi:uncharacterized protein RhaS with RHS repeats